MVWEKNETKKTGMTSKTYGFKHRPSRKGRNDKENIWVCTLGYY